MAYERWFLLSSLGYWREPRKMPAFAAMKLLFIYWGPDNPHQFYYGNSKERNLHADLSL
jgi:hypothetical protein